MGLVLALPPWLYCGTVLVVCLFLRDYRCGDSCSARTEDWRRNVDASEWNLLPWIGGVVFALGTVFLACVWFGRRWPAIVSLVLAAGATLGFALWYEPGWHEHVPDDPAPTLVSVAAFVAGLLSASLGARPRARTD
jgi:hypothetical protein